MWIPETLKVGGHVYTVHQGYVFHETGDLSAQTDNGAHEIRLATLTPGGDSRSRSGVEAIFLHELLHAVDNVYNAHGLEEEVVHRLAEGLYQVLNDNGLLVQDSPGRRARRSARSRRRGRVAH